MCSLLLHPCEPVEDTVEVNDESYQNAAVLGIYPVTIYPD